MWVRRIATSGVAWITVMGMGMALSSVAEARPTGPRAFCETYPDAPECMGRLIACNECHTSTQPVGWNGYGGTILGALDGRPFDEGLPDALRKVEMVDSDGDGLVNIEEIELGTDPGDALSSWMPRPEPEGEPNPVYDVGYYDPAFAYRRVSLLFCGHSPSYEQMQEFEGLDVQTQTVVLHDTLSECLESRYWIVEALPELAHPKIRPVQAYGLDTTVQISGRAITLADYNWDYRLWQYVLTGDRDARELLTAKYFVDIDEQGQWKIIEDEVPNPSGRFGGGQPLPPEHRAGMLTTQWNLLINIMFAGVPRVAAGHAYREYLGLNLSLLEGVRPVAGEPLDIDERGVAQADCAQCHSTLDPLAYGFAAYEGIDLRNLDRTGTFRPERPVERVPGWEEICPTMVILDQEVSSLVEMAEVMANSREFQRNLAEMFFVYAIGHQPGPDELAEFDAIWTAMPSDGYSANRLLHRLIDTDAFGVP